MAARSDLASLSGMNPEKGKTVGCYVENKKNELNSSILI
jgi:hypothetical protein